MAAEEVADSPVPVEVIVHGGRSHPNLRRSQSASSPRVDGARDVDDGAVSEGEGEELVQISRKEFMNECRSAIKDPERMERLIAQAENLPLDALRKALLWAAASGQVEFISRFMQRKPPVFKSLLQTAKDGDGFTPLHRAVVAGQKEIVELLLRHGQDPHSEYFEILHARTPEGWTSLHMAVAAGDEAMVKILIHSYDVIELPPEPEWDFSDKFWMTPLHYAVLGNLEETMIKQLLKWKTYDRHVNAHDYFLRTPVHMAAASHFVTPIETLSKNPKVDINAVDCCLYTPLHWAAYVGATDAVRCLLSKAGHRTIRATEDDIDGRPVLQIAIENTTIDRKLGKDIEKLLLTCPEVKDDVERLYRDRQVYVDAANAILVGAALIASVTFGGWLQPPGGGQPDRQRLRVFWAFNSLSFFFSLATVIAGAGAVLPLEDVYIGKAVGKIRQALALTSFLLIASVVLVLGAFGAAGFVAVLPTIQENMIITTSIGAVLCIIILQWFLHKLYRIGPVCWPAHWKYHRPVRMNRGSRGLEQIQKELEGAATRAREGMQNRNNKTDRKLVELTDMVFDLAKASETESQLRGQASNDPARYLEIVDKDGPWIRNAKEKLLEQQIMPFEEAYEKAMMLRTESGRVQATSSNMLILSNLGPRGVHHWIDDFPSSYCRPHCMKKDAERWSGIRDRLFVYKRRKLEEDSTKFEYGLVAFEFWAG